MMRQKPTKTITGAYTTTDTDNGYRIICNSATAFTITLHSATGRYNFELEVDNIGLGDVTVGSQTLKQYTHAHVGNNGGSAWFVVVGGSSSYTLPQASETILGGIKAKAKTIETKEVVIDTTTGKLYTSDSSGGFLTKSISLYVDDILEVGTNQISIICPQAMTITDIRLAVDTAPTGASLIVDINKNGTTLYTTQANRPTIAIDGTSVIATLPDVVSLVVGDKISLDIDQIGSTVAGENLSIVIICEVV